MFDDRTHSGWSVVVRGRLGSPSDRRRAGSSSTRGRRALATSRMAVSIGRRDGTPPARRGRRPRPRRAGTCSDQAALPVSAQPGDGAAPGSRRRRDERGAGSCEPPAVEHQRQGDGWRGDGTTSTSSARRDVEDARRPRSMLVPTVSVVSSPVRSNADHCGPRAASTTGSVPSSGHGSGARARRRPAVHGPNVAAPGCDGGADRSRTGRRRRRGRRAELPHRRRAPRAARRRGPARAPAVTRSAARGRRGRRRPGRPRGRRSRPARRRRPASSSAPGHVSSIVTGSPAPVARAGDEHPPGCCGRAATASTAWNRSVDVHVSSRPSDTATPVPGPKDPPRSPSARAGRRSTVDERYPPRHDRAGGRAGGGVERAAEARRSFGHVAQPIARRLAAGRASRPRPSSRHPQQDVGADDHLDVDARRRWAWRATLLNASRERGHQLVADVGGDRAVDRAVEEHPRLEAERPRRRRGPAPAPRRAARRAPATSLLEPEDRRADVLDRDVEVVDGAARSAPIAAVGSAAHEPGRALQRHARWRTGAG